MKSLFTALLAMLLGSCATVKPKSLCLKSETGEFPCQPFRAGLINMNYELDAVKPLGTTDVSGWVLENDHIIGAIDSQWLVSQSLKTGQRAWWYELKGSISAPVVALAKYLIVSQRDGTVSKVDIANGKEVWQQTVSKFVSRRVVLSGNQLIVVTVDQKVFSIDYSSGKTNWVYDAGQPVGLVIDNASDPIIQGNQILLGTSEGEIHSIKVATGKRNWIHSPRSSSSRFRDVVGKLHVTDGNLLVTRYDGIVYSLRLSGGRRVLWRKELSSATSSYYRDGVYYLGGLGGDFYALEAKTGRQLWTVKLGQPPITILPGEKVVYVAGTQGRISALDAGKGSILWHDDIGGSTTAPPLLYNNILYYATGLKTLYGFKIL